MCVFVPSPPHTYTHMYLKSWLHHWLNGAQKNCGFSDSVCSALCGHCNSPPALCNCCGRKSLCNCFKKKKGNPKQMNILIRADVCSSKASEPTNKASLILWNTIPFYLFNGYTEMLPELHCASCSQRKQKQNTTGATHPHLLTESITLNKRWHSG